MNPYLSGLPRMLVFFLTEQYTNSADTAHFGVLIWKFGMMIRGKREKNSYNVMKTIRTLTITIKYASLPFL